MKNYALLILFSISAYISIAQDIQLDNGQVEIILDDSIAPGPEGPYYRSWYMGVNSPFTSSPDHFTITRSSVFFGLFAQFSALTIDDSSLFVGIGNDDPLAKLHVNFSSLSNNADHPAILAGEYAGGSYGYLTINKPENDKNDAIAKFRDDGTTIVNINKNDHAYQLDVNGDFRADNFMMVSDARLKTSIQPLSKGRELLNMLKPTSYYLKKDLIKTNGKNAQTQFGFIAQDVEKVLPNLVRRSAQENDQGEYEDLYAVNYIGMIPLIVLANQELSAELEEQKNSQKLILNQLRLMNEKIAHLENKLRNKE